MSDGKLAQTSPEDGPVLVHLVMAYRIFRKKARRNDSRRYTQGTQLRFHRLRQDGEDSTPEKMKTTQQVQIN